jgi:hypothetical protein
MCGRKPRADPRIAEEQAKQRADIEAAKEAERVKVSKAKADALEERKAMVNRIADLEAAAARQTESNKVVPTPTPTPAPTPEPAVAAASTPDKPTPKPTPPPAQPSMTASPMATTTTDSPETPDVITEAPPVKSTAKQREKRVAKYGKTATAGRRGKRSGSRGRRSLITGLGGGIGFFNRFGG